MFVCLADFLKTNLTKFAVICVKRRRKAGFLGAKSSKITLTKEKKREKERAGRKKGGEEKKAMVVLLFFYNGFFADSFWPKKKIERKRSIWR